MKITANKAQFLAAFSAAAAAVPSRTPKDILRNVLMSVRAGQIELVATDQEHAVRCTVEGVMASADGDVLLPTQRVSQIIREISGDTFEMDADDTKLTIKSAGSQFRLTSEDPREFPPVPEFKDADFFRIAAPVFRSMVKRTSFAIDLQSTRYALAGLFIEIEGDTLSLVATDSRRLAVTKTIAVQQGKPKGPTKHTIIPVKSMQIMERSMDTQAEFVDIAIHDNDVMLRSAGLTVYSRLVEGRFPRWRDVILKGGHVVALPVGPFFAAVRQSQIVTDEENRGVKFHFSDSMLSLGSSANSIGESKIELPISYDFEPVEIVFDPKYVSDVLKVLDPAGTIELQLIDGDSAAVVRVEDSYTYVIMPLANDR